ncbi:MAG: c-type cytochrome [Planctomycetota bacterium]
MAKKTSGRSEYSLHIGFGIGSVLLLITTAYVFYQDHFGREFPAYQEMYRQFDLKQQAESRKKANAELGEAEYVAKAKEYQETIKKNKTAVDAQKPAIEKLRGEAAGFGNLLAAVTISLNAMKANYDELKSQVDSGVQKDRSTLEKLDKEISQKAADQYKLKEQRDQKAGEAAALEEGLAKAKREEDALFADLNDYRSKMAKIKGDPLINTMLDLPGVDFVAPRDKIEQVILNNLKWSVFFADASRVDRCVSCHKGIDNPDPAYAELGKETVTVDKGVETVVVFEKEKKVLKSHPRLDLFVGANSKHPYKKFGCTICHGGQPLATKFSAAAHSPKDKNQENYWAAQYDWQRNEYWDAKMLPLQHVEASCAKCHKNVDEVPEAAKLNEGRHLFRDRGCVNCHFGTSGTSDMSWVGRVGPDLRRVGEKVADINWARAWIENPWDFRPSTKMPRFLGLENHKDKAYEIQVNGKVHARDAVEAEAITNYLFLASKLRETPPPVPKDGNVEEGRKLYAAVGCVGCHQTKEAGEKDNYTFNQHGPDLSRVGDKVRSGWLYQWVKNPRHYWAETKMPNLRLTDEEAANLTSYIMSTMKSAKGGTKALEPHPSDAFDKIVVEKLASILPEEEIRNRLKTPLAMVEKSLKLKVKYATKVDNKGESKRYDTGDGEWTEGQIEKLKELISKEKDPERAAKAFYTGETLIQHHGCYSCHNIQGWTYAPLTCVNLSGEADKDLDKFDFGKAGHDHSISETKWDWFFAKISRPRVFDRDKEDLIKPFDRLRMPWFGYTSKNNEEVAAEAHKEGAKAGEKHTEGHSSTFKKYAPENNEDISSTQVLGKHEVTRLVTYLMSLTNEVIPAEMIHQPTPKEAALDKGKRVVRELNCTGCHMASVGSAVTNDGKTTMPLAAFAALSTPKSRAFLKTPGNGIYSDDDLVSLDYTSGDTTMKGFLNIERGSFLSEATVPILLEEFKVRTSPLLEWEKLSFKFEKKAKGDSWKLYGDLVTEAEYIKLTELLYEEKLDEKGKRDYSEVKSSYAILAKQFVDVKAYERMAGTDALKLTNLKKDELRAVRKYYDPVVLNVRLTRGEGRLMNHIMNVERDMYKTENVSQQHAPPSLGFEGGKVQPDWLYQFLHNVKTLRVGLNVRMPSFWTDGPYSSFKTIYPAGRLSAVDPNKRDKGAGGEPLPGPDATKFTDVQDDAQQIVDFFVADSGDKPYGNQPVMLDADQKKLYELGKRYVTEFPADDNNKSLVGIGCVTCHSIGNYTQPVPKYAPNLVNVKRRLKGDWMRRFLTFPPSLYPWTNMPNNFINWGEYNHDLKDLTRGIAEEPKLKDQAQKMEAVRFFLQHTGDGEFGSDVKSAPPVPPSAPKK